ncbi:MAG: glutamate 5-kinase [Fibromonadaceae bacterium]|jgi:glutamate 5-kinase|nr:glutamate 5-kinase [Fibromonadaceae bacterium]
MSDLRKNLLAEAKRIVIKIGSRILLDAGSKGVNLGFIKKFAESAAALRLAGKEIVIVSSGAVGAGMARLGYAKKPGNIADRQVCAAVGQIDLMHAYREAFEKEKMAVGQILLSAEDFRNRNRYKNLQNTLNSMLKHKIIPIINENDSVAVAEIKVGDNDKLSSDVALFWNADLLLLFTDENGLFDSNPKTNPNARLLNLVPEVTAEILSLAGKPGDAGSAVSTGGMHSKLEAVRAVTRSGCNAFLANGTKILPSEILSGNAVGTLFLGNAKKLGSRKKWLSFVSTPKGSITIDDGGVNAIRKKNASVLPVGITGIHGHFSVKDLIDVKDLKGNKVARGISRFNSESLRKAIGMKNQKEAVHKNDLVVF